MAKRFDLRRLERDLSVEPKRTGLAPGGRPATGLMALVRDNLDQLIALQASGHSWDVIAAGLNKQGYTTADGRPLNGRHLTGVISSVKRQTAKRAAAQVARAGRADLPKSPGRRLALAPDLATSPPQGGGSYVTDEQEIREERLDRLKDILKD